MNTKVPMEIVNSFLEIIQEIAPSAVIEVMRQQVRELSQVVQNDRFVTNSLRGLVVDLQEKFYSPLPRDYSLLVHLLAILPHRCLE